MRVLVATQYLLLCILRPRLSAGALLNTSDSYLYLFLRVLHYFIFRMLFLQPPGL